MLKKYIAIRQHDATDCAAACIATICLYYKKEISITKLRDLLGTDIRGTNVEGIINSLKKLGFDAKAGKVNQNSFKGNFSLPAIAHIITKEGQVHFIVINKIGKKKIIISDPAYGIRKKEFSDFFEEFSGTIILCKPNNDFISERKSSNSVFRRFANLLLTQKKLFFCAIIGSIILTILGIASSFFNKFLMDEILPYNLKNQLLILCIGFALVGFFNILMNAVRQHLLLHLSIKIDIPLMLGYFKHIFSLPMKFFSTRKTGDIITRFQDAGTIKNVFSSISLSLIIDILLASISGVILANMNLKLFGIIALITVINIILVYIFKKPYKNINIRKMEKASLMNSQIIDSLKGVETIKSFGVEEETLDKIENRYMDSIKEGYHENVLSNVQGTISGFIGNISNIFLMYVGATLVMNSNITLGSLFAFMSLSSYFMDPIGRLVGLQMQLQEASVAMKRMSELYDLEPEQNDKIKLIDNFDINGDIKIDNVSFRYGTRPLTLNNINLTIKNKSKVALVGESGCGKTTLAKLLLGLYNLENGNIFINDYNIEEINKKVLRSKIAYVGQNIELFSGTIFENITLGCSGADIQQVKNACERAGCNNFIEKLALNYYTYLEEAGANLSGGERQRIALARALIKKPDLLILDESTSNLDFISEAKVYNTLFNLSCTIIIIAHRLSTVRKCDEIIVIDKNRIVECGKHQELLDKKEVYYKIWNSQIGEELGIEKKIINTNSEEITYP